MNNNKKPVQKAMRIFEALSGVDEELLIECNRDDVKSDKVIPFWKYGKAAAACFCLLVAGALVWTASVNGGFRSVKTSDNAAAVEVEQMADSYERADTTENMQMDVGNGVAGMWEDNDSVVEDAIQNDGEAVSEGAMQEESVLEKEMASEDSSHIHDTQPQMQIQSYTTPVPTDNREKISELAAKKLEVYGAYIPDELPDGYTFESANKIKDPKTGEENGVSLIWTKGMDRISWMVRKVEVTDVRLTDIAKSECYNVHMYEIPYADTVPEKYREVFYNPIFKREELSLEIVDSRMKVVQDAGDTDTPRGNFSVFCEEGILIEFMGDGTAEEIWNLFSALQR